MQACSCSGGPVYRVGLRSWLLAPEMDLQEGLQNWLPHCMYAEYVRRLQYVVPFMFASTYMHVYT